MVGETMWAFSRLLPLLFLSHFACGGNIITECNSRLPMSLSTVISDLEAEGVTEVTTACLLTSRSVTSFERAAFFGIEDTSTTSIGTESGLCLAISPNSISEVASTALACSGNLVFLPSEDDLSRGEGLFDYLGPAMERILNEDLNRPTQLIIVSNDPVHAKSRLEEAAVDVLRSLVTSKKVSLLEDVFDSIQYVKNAEQALEIVESQSAQEPSQAQSTIAATVASDFWQIAPNPLNSPMSARDLAAARQLGPAARKAREVAIETVRRMSEGVVVPNFGELCEAASQRASDDLDASSLTSLASSAIGRQISSNLKDEMTSALVDLSEKQLDLLKEACFEEFKRDLSKLRISPNLEADMKEVAEKSLANFSQRSKKIPTNLSNGKAMYKAQLKEFCENRLVAARASGQFRPVPRKGVTIGLHWLLPKPFGNDYRQEPWMVHATDDLVYVPPDKISDISPEEVAAGDWRKKIVPSPAGNEMIYMQ